MQRAILYLHMFGQNHACECLSMQPKIEICLIFLFYKIHVTQLKTHLNSDWKLFVFNALHELPLRVT